MTKRKFAGYVLGVACGCAAPAGWGQFIYDNTTTSVFNSYGTTDPTVNTFGDYVFFSSGPSVITEVSFLMYASKDAVDPEANFGLFVYDDNGGTVGSLLGSFSLDDYVFSGSGSHTLTFSGLSVPVGTSAFIGLSIENYNGGGGFEDFIGVEMFDPPTVGSSDADTMLVTVGVPGLNPGQLPSVWLGAGLNNMAMTIIAVPEPVEVSVIAGLGLVAFGALRRRRDA